MIFYYYTFIYNFFYLTDIQLIVFLLIYRSVIGPGLDTEGSLFSLMALMWLIDKQWY